MFKETDRIELKRELNDSLKKEIVAFVNTNGGKIYIGIDDDGRIIGLSHAKKNMEAISKRYEALGCIYKTWYHKPSSFRRYNSVNDK